MASPLNYSPVVSVKGISLLLVLNNRSAREKGVICRRGLGTSNALALDEPLISLDRDVERRSSADKAYVTPIIPFS